MSVIKHSLLRLDGVIGKLEGSLSGLEQTLAGEQRDMFGAPSDPVSPSENNNIHDLQADVIAERLDKAIEQVEELLAEEEGA